MSRLIRSHLDFDKEIVFENKTYHVVGTVYGSFLLDECSNNLTDLDVEELVIEQCYGIDEDGYEVEVTPSTESLIYTYLEDWDWFNEYDWKTNEI